MISESGYCAQEKIYLPEYNRLRAAVTWKYLRLRTLYYIKNVSVLVMFQYSN
ncbi:hypothetical protein C0J52_27772 [Blattella germanica]|nr:hypothetical protein C0J52_27772 [Blattella germanica]